MVNNKTRKTQKKYKNNTKTKTNNKNPKLLLFSSCKKDNKFLYNAKRIINKKFKNTNNLKMAIIITARYGFRNKLRTKLYENCIKKIKSMNLDKLNIPYTLIDCSSKNNLKKFKENINNSQIIFALGGDTFYLNYHLKKSKMDKLIINKLKNSNSLYMACSAGAILTGQTIYPASILRFNKKSNMFHINNTYKPKFLTKKKNQKGLKLFKNMDFMPHCTLNNKKKILKLKESKKIYCLLENNIFIK